MTLNSYQRRHTTSFFGKEEDRTHFVIDLRQNNLSIKIFCLVVWVYLMKMERHFLPASNIAIHTQHIVLSFFPQIHHVFP